MQAISTCRGRHIFLALVFGIVIAAVWALSPYQEAKAQSGSKNQMVSKAGHTITAKSSGLVVEGGFEGTGSLGGIAAEELDMTGPVGLPGLIPGSVIGPDGRTRVMKTKVYPYRANAFLEVTFPSSKGTCTGWFIGPRTLMTAGHCVYDTATNQWATAIKIFPARNGSTAPYGSVMACNLWSVNGWVISENREYDYGAIMLPSTQALGNTVGWYHFFWTSNASALDEKQVNIYGYPGDKNYGTQWGMRGRIKEVYTRRLFHNVDTAGGESGSAVYETRSDGPYANSIHTYAAGGGTPYNSSTRITQGVFNNMLSWKNNPTCY